MDFFLQQVKYPGYLRRRLGMAAAVGTLEVPEDGARMEVDDGDRTAIDQEA